MALPPALVTEVTCRGLPHHYLMRLLLLLLPQVLPLLLPQILLRCCPQAPYCRPLKETATCRHVVRGPSQGCLSRPSPLTTQLASCSQALCLARTACVLAAAACHSLLLPLHNLHPAQSWLCEPQGAFPSPRLQP